MAARFTSLRALRTPSVALSSRMQFTTSSRLALKESSSRTFPPPIFPVLSSIHVNTKTMFLETDVDYEHHKQDSLKKQKEGAAHWKPELASDSEEAVKADR